MRGQSVGHWDDFLPDPLRSVDNEALRWWKDQLAPGDRAWLRALPFSHDLVRFMHASAQFVHRRVRYSHDQDELLGQFVNTAAPGDGPIPDTVMYADTHDPMYECQLRGRHLRVPYEVEAELAHARQVGMPSYDGYEIDCDTGVYRGNLADYRAGAFNLDEYYH